MAADATLSASSGIRTATQQVVDAGLMHGLWLSLMQALLVCGLIAGGYFAMPWLQPAFDRPITRIVVNGDFRALDRRAIEDAVVIYDTDSFLDVDLRSLVRRLEEQPWVAHARARRQWPDTVAVDIVEQVPIAYWGDRWMLNAKGRLFEHQGRLVQQPLPHLWSALATPAETMNHYQIFERQLDAVGLRLVAVSHNLQGDWQLSTANGLSVMLDRTDPAENVRHFVSVYQQVVLPAQRVAQLVDMRYRHGAAIRWQPMVESGTEQTKKGGEAEHGRG